MPRRAAFKRRPDRAGRHRVGHVVALVAPHPRRPALPGAAPDRARSRGARRTEPAAAQRPASRDARAAAVPDPRHPVPEQGVLRRGPDPVRHPGRPPRRRLAPPPERRRDRWRSRRPCAARACAADCSITTAWRTTPDWPWPSSGPRSPARRGPLAVTRVQARGPRHATPRHGTHRGAACPRRRVRRRARDPDAGRRRRHRRLGGRSGAPVLEPIDPDPAEPGRPPRRAARADPRDGRPHDPRPGQGRVPRPVAGPLADRHDGRALRRPLRPAGRRRLGDRRAPADRQRHARRRPAAERRRRHVRGPAAAHRAEPAARRSRPRASTASPSSRTASSGSAAASTRPTGSWPATSSTPCSGARARSGCPSATAERRLVGAADRPVLDRIVAEIASVPAVAAAHPEAAARLVARHGTEAPGVVALGGELDLLRPLVPGPARSSRPRSPGPSGTSSRCRSTTSCRAGCASARSWPIAGATVAPRVAEIMGRRARLGRRAPRPRGRRLPRDRGRRIRGRALAVGARVGAGAGARRRRRSRADAVTRRSRAAATIAPCHRSAISPTTSPERCTSSGSRSPSRRSRWRSWPSSSPYRLGWIAAARRHPGRTGAVAAVALAVALPVGWYLGSPIFIRTSLVEAEPAVAARPPRRPSPPPHRSIGAVGRALGLADGASDPAPRRRSRPRPWRAASSAAPTTSISGSGTASIVEVEPGRYHLRLDDFSVRNGPDLFVYLSPDADGYADDALELGKLKATDGSFGYDLPDGVDPARFRSALIWCKQFSHLFAVAPFGG